MTKDLLIPGVNNYYYEASLNCEIPDIFTDHKNYYWQGGAYYNDYIVIAYINCPYFEVRKLSTKERLGVAYTGTEYSNIHANSIWFGAKSNSSSYELPLLWVSSESEGTIYSFQISDDFTTAELHSKIVLPNTFNGTRLYYINSACSNSEGRILIGGYDHNDYKYDSQTTATYKYYIVSDAKCNEVYEYIKNSEKDSTLTLTEDDFNAIELDPILNWKDISYSQGMSQGSNSMFLQAFGNNSGIIGYKNSVHIACKNYDSDNSGKYKSFVLNVADFEDVFGFKEMEGAIITSLSDSAPFPKQIILQTEVPVSIVNTTRQYKFIQLDLKEGQPGQLYTIIVNGGTSDKTTAKAGETVTLTPNNIDDFAYWEVNDVQIEGNTFIMPSENVVCNAIYRQSPSRDKITPTKEDIVVYGRIVSGSTEGVACDASQVFSDDYIKKYNNSPQFKTDGFQSSINDKLIQLYSNVVAGSVEWDNIKNKPNVAILGTGDADGTDANSGRILFQTEYNNDGYAIIGNDSDSYSISVSQDDEDNSRTIYISPDSVSVSSTKKIGDDINKVEIHSNGIILSNREGVPSNCVFMTDGTTQELTAITTDELNQILI